MPVQFATKVIAGGTAIALLASCTGQSLAPTLAPTVSLPAKLDRQGACHCLYVSVPYSAAFPQGAVGVYASGARGDAKPLQYIAGSNTRFHTPSDVAVNSKGEIFVVNYGGKAVTVYAAGATGNVAPTTSITGAASL